MNRVALCMLARPEGQAKFLANRAEAAGSTPPQLATRAKAEVAKCGRVIQQVRIERQP